MSVRPAAVGGRSYAARAAGLAVVATLPVYAATMNRTIGFIDRGELAAVAATFGIAHPTGYPTLMLIAGLVVRAVPLRPVLVVNAFAALLTAAGAALLTLLLERVLRAVAPASVGPRLRAAYALLAGLCAAFTVAWWQQAAGFEVYALHTVFMPAVALLCLRWLEAGAGQGADAAAAERRAGRVFALVTGLSFTNHLTTILLAPGLVTAAAMRFGAGRGLWRRLLPLAPPFVLGLLPYAWLPIRSRMNPRLDWGEVRSLGAFLHHVSGADYQRWMFADRAAMALQLRYLVWRVPLDFAIVGILVAALGALLLVQRAPRLAAMALGFVLAGAVFATGYGIPDLDAYLLTIVLGVAMCLAAGLGVLHERFGRATAVTMAAALVLVNVAVHWRDCDERDNAMVEHCVHDVFDPLPRNAVLFTDRWENLESASEYFQEVEGLRRDVLVVSPELARHGWYLDVLARRAPALVARAGESFRRYREAVRWLESGGDVRSAVPLEAARGEFVAGFATACMQDRAVFTTGPLPGMPAAWRGVPWCFVTWLRADTAYVPEPPLSPAFRAGREAHGPQAPMDVYAALTVESYARARRARGRYEAAHGRDAAAREAVRGARAFDPHIRPERVGPLPLGTDRNVLATARFFRDLEATDPLAPAR